MTAEIKYWVWIAVWSCSCLLAISKMQGGNSDDAVNNDVISYWETKLHGARMPTYLRALVSPLTSREATQFLVDISGSGGHYFPSNAASFCNAAHIQCAQVGKEPTEEEHSGQNPYFTYPFTNNDEDHNQNPYFTYPFKNSDEDEEHSRQNPYFTYPFKNSDEDHNQNPYFTYPFTNNDNDKEHSEDHSRQNPYFTYPFKNNDEDHSHQNPYFTYPFTNSDEEHSRQNPYFTYPFTNNDEDHSGGKNPYFTYPFKNNHEEHRQKIRRFLYGEVGKESEASSQSKPTLKAYNKIEDRKALDLLTVGNVHEISTYYFREKQVLVSGVHIQYVNFTSFTGDGAEEDDKVDRAFLPRKLAKLFPLMRGHGAKIASMLRVPDKDLQETLGLCAKARAHGMNAEVGMCLPSIEDVADFVGSVLGASPNGIDIYDAASNANRGNAGSAFHVLNVKKLKADPDEPHVSCHDMAFPFRVFFCHYPKRTNLFQVTLQGEDESTHERIAICHYDTSSWNPLHVSLAELHTKPGESEACHWLASTWSGHSGWVFVRKAAVI